jgi:hypothetical protein
MAFVVLSAVGLAALRNADDVWSGLTFQAALAVVGGAALGAIFVNGEERAWWVGFAFFGGGYLALTFGPWVSDTFRLQLGTTHLIGQLRGLMFASEEQALLLEMQQIEAELANVRAATGSTPDGTVARSMTRNLRALQAQLAARKNAALRNGPFQRVGHCLFACLSGLVGGTVAVRFWRKRELREASQSAD